jgi:hypothetical protein
VTLGRYLLGIAGLAAVVVPVAFAAVALRRRWLPGWSGSPARVAEAVLALALVVGAAQLVGVVGLFRPGFLVGVTVALGLAASRLGGGAGQRVKRRRPPAPDRVAMVVAALTAAAVVGVWSANVAGALEKGMSRTDTLFYHAPLAARFVQEQSIAHPFYATDDQFVTFLPANSELLHAIGMLLMGSDVLSPLLNLGWLVLALAAAWAVGRPFGRGPATLTGAAVALATPVFVRYQPGEAFNDVVIVALFLAVAALLVNGGREPAPIAVAALAAGLAVGTKVTAILPAAALTIAVVLLLRRGRRLRVGGLWLLPLLAVASLWYFRNLFAFGSPLPAVRLGFGPVALPSVPDSPHVYGGSYTVTDYATDWEIWDRWFLPWLDIELGPVWWAVLGLAALGMAVSLAHPVRPTLRVVSVLAISSAVVYPFTPRTAGGPEGIPWAFGGTLRYLVPAVALGLAVLPLARTLTGHTRQRLAVVVLAALALIVLHDSRGLVDRHPATTLLLAAITLAFFAVLWARPAVPRRLAVVGGTGLLVLIGGLGWAAERRLQRDRYAEIAPWARELKDTRIAIVGQVLGYPLYGRDLSNHVQYVARKSAHGAFLPIRSCREWRAALNEGRYRYLVVNTTVNLLLAAHGFSQARPEVGWTGSDPAARRLPVGSGRERVFRIDGRLDPRTCSGRTEAAARRLGRAGR